MAALLALSLAGGAAALPADRAVVVTDLETGERIAAVGVTDGSTVTLTYVHSVERSPVVEEYTVVGDGIEMTRMTFRTYGWGLPAGAEVDLVDGAFVTRPEWRGTELVVAVGPIAGHELRINGRPVDLDDRRTVRIAVVRRSALTTVFEALAHP